MNDHQDILSAFIGNIGPLGILLILALALLFFGGSKLPQLGESLGKSIQNFKKASRTDDETKQSAHAPPKAIENQSEGREVEVKAEEKSDAS